jgi:Holliday junction resolvase-like predicted endonuclease
VACNPRSPMSAVSRGNAAENLVASYLEDRGWVIGGRRHRAGGGDWLAVRGPGERRLVEVKSDKRGPFEHFGPKARAELLATAKKIDADPLRAWVRGGNVSLIPHKDFPPR